MFRIRRVVGGSMLPALREGDIVVATRLKGPAPGRMVIARYDGRELVKRVGRVEGDRYCILGDNESFSTDSRSFGLVDKADILGSVIMMIRFANLTPPPAPVSRNLLWIPYGLAVIITMILLGSLAVFEDIVIYVQRNLISDDSLLMAKIYSAVFVLALLLSLPFLLRMRLSYFTRVLSASVLLMLPVVGAAGMALYGSFEPKLVVGWAAVSIWAVASFAVLSGRLAYSGSVKTLSR